MTNLRAVQDNCPCKDCEKREPGCHSKCEDYIAWKSQLDTTSQVVREARIARAKNFPDSIAKNIRKSKK